MNEIKLAELLQNRLYLELQLFKDSMLQKTKEEIYSESCRIEIYVNLYEIAASHAASLKKDTVCSLLNFSSGILDFLYREWLDREDSFYGELEAYACDVLETVPETGRSCRKEAGDGKEPDQAA